MILSLVAPLLALALTDSAAAPACAESSAAFPPPGCTVYFVDGVCYLNCVDFPYFRTCDPD